MLKLALASVFAFGLAGAAQAAVVDFEDQPSGNCAFIGTSFSSGGMTFTKLGSSTGFFQCDPGTLAQNTSKAVIDANARSFFEMTEEAGDLFSLLSFDAGTRTQAAFLISTGIEVIGYRSDLSTVTQTITFDGLSFDTFSLSPGFINLTRVTLEALGSASSPEFVFDNIVYSIDATDVPLPAGLPLLGAGLLSFAMLRRRR